MSGVNIGVPVLAISGMTVGIVYYRTPALGDGGQPTHRVFPEAVALAMQAVIVGVDRYAGACDAQNDEIPQARTEMFAALDALADLTIHADTAKASGS